MEAVGLGSNPQTGVIPRDRATPCTGQAALLGAEQQHGGPGARSQCNPGPAASMQCDPVSESVFSMHQGCPCTSPLRVQGSHKVTRVPPSLDHRGVWEAKTHCECIRGLANLWDQRGGWADLSPPLTAQGRKPGANPAQRDATPRARPVCGISGRPPGDTGVNPVGVQLPPAMARWATFTENRGSHPLKVSARSPNHRKNIGLLTSAKTRTHGSSGVHHWGGAAWRLCPHRQGRNTRPEGLRHRSLCEGALSSRRDPSCSSAPKWLELTVFLWNYHCASLNEGYGSPTSCQRGG